MLSEDLSRPLDDLLSLSRSLAFSLSRSKPSLSLRLLLRLSLSFVLDPRLDDELFFSTALSISSSSFLISSAHQSVR
jgi:predicted Kef-type K+ transport protein